MKTFKDLEFNPHSGISSGVQAKATFENGFGVSVIRTPFSYGGDEGLYELAVLGQDGHLTYDTPVTDDVEGYCNEDRITDLLRQVQELPGGE